MLVPRLKIKPKIDNFKLLHKLKPNDVLVVKSIDRLGKNYVEILEQWRIITKEKNAAVVVLNTPLLDTRRHHDIVGAIVADFVLQIMSTFAQIECNFIRQRQAEGIIVAKARGVKFEQTNSYKNNESSRNVL